MASGVSIMKIYNRLAFYSNIHIKLLFVVHMIIRMVKISVANKTNNRIFPFLFLLALSNCQPNCDFEGIDEQQSIEYTLVIGVALYFASIGCRNPGWPML